MSIAAVVALSASAIAGGNIAVIEPEVEVIVPEKTGFYVGGAYGYVTAESTASLYNYEVTTFDENYNSVMIDAGYEINEFVAVEGRYWFGVNKTVDYGDFDGDLYSVDSRVDAWGVYVKPQYSFASAKVYALAGYASTEYDVTGKMDVVSAKYKETLDGFSWGLGAAYAINDSIEVFVDYVNMYDSDSDFVEYGDIVTYNDTLSTVNVGLNYKF